MLRLQCCIVGRQDRELVFAVVIHEVVGVAVVTNWVAAVRLGAVVGLVGLQRSVALDPSVDREGCCAYWN